MSERELTAEERTRLERSCFAIEAQTAQGVIVLDTASVRSLLRAARERDELRAQLGAWARAFGSSQLTHAAARLEAAERENERLRRWRDDVAILVKDEGGIHFDDVAPRVKELRAQLGAANERVKALELMLSKAVPRLDTALRHSRNRNELDALHATNDLADIRAALAPKEAT